MDMNICRGIKGRFHDQVVYQGTDCPACEALAERDDAQSKLETAEQRLDQLIEAGTADIAERDALIAQLRHDALVQGIVSGFHMGNATSLNG
jgi:hypothetical protein